MKSLVVVAVAVVVASFAFTGVANAAIIGLDTGTGAPPAFLGTYAISALPDDGRAVIGDVLDAPGSPPLSGDITFGAPVSHREIGSGWASWSHGYAGDVYYTNGGTSVTIGLPANTGAFLLYAEPDPFSIFSMTATANDGTFVTANVDGSSGANGFGFYGTGGTSLASITVSSDVGFAVGEFYGARVPEPATLTMLALGVLTLIRRRF